MGDLPNKAFISLREAVTWLAFGEADPGSKESRNSKSEHRRRPSESPYNKLMKLIQECRSEADADDRFQAFPRKLRTMPLKRLVKELDACRSSWPPSGRRLYDLAYRLQSAEARLGMRLLKCDAAWSLIRQAAQVGTIKVYGRRDRPRNSPYEAIPKLYFLGDIEPDPTFRHIDIRSIADCISSVFNGMSYAWYDVRIKSDEIKHLHSLRRHSKETALQMYPANLETFSSRPGAPPRKRESALKAISELYRDGIPVDLKLAALHAEVNDHLKKQGLPQVSVDTIRRAKKGRCEGTQNSAK